MAEYFYTKYNIALEIDQPLLFCNISHNHTIYLPTQLCHRVLNKKDGKFLSASEQLKQK